MLAALAGADASKENAFIKNTFKPTISMTYWYFKNSGKRTASLDRTFSDLEWDASKLQVSVLFVAIC